MLSFEHATGNGRCMAVEWRMALKELSVLLDLDGGRPIYEQIYDYIKREIREGKLKFEAKLPSTRALSEHLNVSRSTVQLADDQLVSEGYIESRPCRGYYVLKLDGLYNLTAVEYKEMHRSVSQTVKYEIDFSPSGIELDNFFNIVIPFALIIFLFFDSLYNTLCSITNTI